MYVYLCVTNNAKLHPLIWPVHIWQVIKTYNGHSDRHCSAWWYADTWYALIGFFLNSGRHWIPRFYGSYKARIWIESATRAKHWTTVVYFGIKKYKLKKRKWLILNLKIRRKYITHKNESILELKISIEENKWIINIEKYVENKLHIK
jgi:hypothetical protein